jgi:hypothetical protein
MESLADGLCDGLAVGDANGRVDEEDEEENGDGAATENRDRFRESASSMSKMRDQGGPKDFVKGCIHW